MSTEAKPKAGLEDVVAGESSICYIDGDRGVLSYQGYDIHDLANAERGVSFEECCYLLWHGRLPDARGAGRPADAARGRAAAARADHPGDAVAAESRRHGRAAHADVDARPLRCGSRGTFAGGELPEGGPPDRPDQLGGRDVGPAGRRRRADRSGSGARPRRKLPVHADRPAAVGAGGTRVRRVARAARRSRAERLDVCRAGGGGDADRHSLRDRRRDRRAQGTASRRRQCRRHEDAARDRQGRRRRAGRGVRPRQARAQGEDRRLRPPRLSHGRSARHAPAALFEDARREVRPAAVVRDVAADRGAGEEREAAESERRLLFGVDVLLARDSDRSLHADLRRQPHLGVDGARARAVRQQSADPAPHRLHRPALSAADPAD